MAFYTHQYFTESIFAIIFAFSTLLLSRKKIAKSKELDTKYKNLGAPIPLDQLTEMGIGATMFLEFINEDLAFIRKHLSDETKTLIIFEGLRYDHLEAHFDFVEKFKSLYDIENKKKEYDFRPIVLHRQIRESGWYRLIKEGNRYLLEKKT